jgi:hypothetical protein
MPATEQMHGWIVRSINVRGGGRQLRGGGIHCSSSPVTVA